MVGYFNRSPRPGSTDEAAQKLLRMLEREEREAAELKRLKESGWQPPQRPIPPGSSDVAFGDGRDAIVDQVQAGLDYQNALRAEAQRRARAAATPAVWSAPSNGSLGDDDPRLILVGDSKPAGGGARPAATPYEMTPALAQWMGLGMGAAGVALSMQGLDRALHHWLNRRDHAISQDVGDYPYPGSPRDRGLVPLEGSHAGESTAQRTVTGVPGEAVPGPSPGSAVADFEALTRPAPSRAPDPIENWSIEKLIPPEIARQDPQPSGYAEGSPVPKLEPLIREAWSPTAQELLDWLLSLNSKGSPLTQRGVDQMGEWLIKGAEARGYTGKHEYGGTSKKEKYYAAPDGGRWGSGRTDGSVRIERAGEEPRWLEFNTAKFLQDRITPVAHERRALEKLRRLQAFANKTAYGVWAFPKEHGFTRQDWEDQVKGMIDDLLTDLLGPPK